MRVVIVGAGFGGIGAAIELRKHGFDDVVILDRAAELGGTWLLNDYPGAACDVPSHLYSYSFAQRRHWTRLCSPRDEILGLPARGRARARHRPPRHAEHARSRAPTYDGRWTLTSTDGRTWDADAVIIATGQLHRTHFPRIEGTFAGHSFHSAEWDHGYDLRGKRVAVIGTGASAVQFVPELARQVDKLVVFQRTGNWFLPRRNRPYPRWFKALVEGARRPGVPAPVHLLVRRVPDADDPPPAHVGEARSRALGAFMRWQLKDAELRRKVWPDYTFGCKRVLFSSHFLPALQRPNVELVTEPITQLTPRGVKTDGREHEVDCIIYATGFRATDFMFPMEIERPRRRHAARRVGGRPARASGDHGARLPVAVPDLRAEHEHVGRLDHLLRGGAGRLHPPGAGARRERGPRRTSRPRATASCRRGSPARRGRAATPGTATSTAGS